MKLTSMKIKILFLLLACLSCNQSNPTQQKEPVAQENIENTPTESEVESEEIDSKEVTTENMVYVTNEGDKYHTADCRYSKTAHEVMLSQAKADGKTACGLCKPSSITGEKQIRCATTTSSGSQCKRMTTDPSGRCFQHRDS